MVLGAIFGLLGIDMLVALMFRGRRRPLCLRHRRRRAGRDRGRLRGPSRCAGSGPGHPRPDAINGHPPRRHAGLYGAGHLGGYHLVLGLSHIEGAHGIWQQVFAVIGSATIGVTAYSASNPVITPALPPYPA